tara:strand:- start:659 stop:1333 length:675 start_codon:yes stop_codon:yes gene_type:complete
MNCPELFDYKDFAMKDNWKVTIQPFGGSHIIFVDEIYERPERIHDYLQQIPVVSLKPPGKEKLNGKQFIDGQTYINLKHDPCRENLFKNIIKFYNLSEDDPHHPSNPISIVNQFRLLEDFPGQPYFWTPHVDNNINVLIYLNPDEYNTPGTSIYTADTEKGQEVIGKDTEHTIPWKDSSWFTERLCIFNRFNSLVAFPGQWPHGQTIVDNRYKDKTRFTEVTFF